jgi:hypothetical protein
VNPATIAAEKRFFFMVMPFFIAVHPAANGLPTRAMVQELSNTMPGQRRVYSIPFLRKKRAFPRQKQKKA